MNHPAYGTNEYRQLRERDAIRRDRIREAIATRGIDDPRSMFQAAMIFQHGDESDDIWQAHVFSKAAAEAGYAPARWLAAASLDRWLMYQGKPQKFGTNIVPDGKRQRVWDVDPTTTDEDRTSWDVPCLEEMHRRAEEATRNEPMPPMDEVPWWLRQAIRRWYPDD